MIPLLLAVLLAGAPAEKTETACPTDCAEECWLLVYRYSYTNDMGRRMMRETFDGQRFPSEEAAYCRAEELRQTGLPLPVLPRYGRDSNVMPEVITPMPHLGAVRARIQPAHPWQAAERPTKP